MRIWFVLIALCFAGCRVGILGHAKDKWKCPSGRVAIYYDRGGYPACVDERIAALTTCTKALSAPQSMVSAQADASSYMGALEKCIDFAGSLSPVVDAGAASK